MRQHLKEPTIAEIADEIGIDKEMIVYAMDAIQSPVSLFEPVYSEGGDTLYVMDQISDKKNLEENWVEDISLRDAMNRLGERERHIIDLRFYEGKTQMEVADEIGISQAQVSRLEKHAPSQYAKLSPELIHLSSDKKLQQNICYPAAAFISYFSAFSFLRSRSEAPSALHISYLRIPECAMVHKQYWFSEASHLLLFHTDPIFHGFLQSSSVIFHCFPDCSGGR